jgi:hypothetical protein
MIRELRNESEVVSSFRKILLLCKKTLLGALSREMTFGETFQLISLVDF